MKKASTDSINQSVKSKDRKRNKDSMESVNRIWLLEEQT